MFIRKCPWERLPLGSVVLEWPQLHNASIPELMGYPLVTEALRSCLQAKYRFLEGRKVTIADPSLALDEPRVTKAALDARRLLSGLAAADSLKRRLRDAFLGKPDAREGLALAVRNDIGPYSLRKDWMRSVATIIRDSSPFGSCVWGDAAAGEAVSLGATIGALLAGELPPPPDSSSSRVDLAIDVSHSMAASGKAELAWSVLADLVATLSRGLGTSLWRIWLLADRAVPVDLARLGPGTLPSLADLVASSRLKTERTSFSPFVDAVDSAFPDPGRRLCMLVTDGACMDRASTLRGLERLGTSGVDYLQLVLHADEDLREAVVSNDPDAVRDGIFDREELREGERLVIRPDEELDRLCASRLREVTDLAEAARGGQLVLSWNPLLGTVALDVYERFLGDLVAGMPLPRPFPSLL